VEQLPAEGQQGGSAAVGEEAEVAYPNEAPGEQVEEEAAQELIGGQRHESLPVAVSGVAPAEGDVAVFEDDESVVGNGDSMGVGAEIAQGVLWSSEGAFGVDHPVVTEQGSQPGTKRTWFSQVAQAAVELEIACVKGGLQSGDELAAEDAAEHLDGQKEAAGGADPAGMIRSQSAGSQDAMQMRVETPTRTIP
jgi:hypothetical protein